jgi:hypothetical protein
MPATNETTSPRINSKNNTAANPSQNMIEGPRTPDLDRI